MRKTLKQYFLSVKFLFLTTVVFSMCGIWTRFYLKNGNNFSVLKSIIYSFNLEKGTLISINELKIIAAYIVLFYLLIDFISKYLSEIKYLYIIRLKSLYAYINKLIIYAYIISSIYFLIGFGIIYMLNYNISIKSGTISDIKFIIELFIIINLTMFLFINLIILFVIYKKDFKIAIAVVIGLFMLGIIGIYNKIPAYYLYSYRLLETNSNEKIIIYISYLISIVLTYIIIIKSVKQHKDFLLYEYDI